jgi:hypothetical protein
MSEVECYADRLYRALDEIDDNLDKCRRGIMVARALVQRAESIHAQHASPATLRGLGATQEGLQAMLDAFEAWADKRQEAEALLAATEEAHHERETDR